MHSRPRLVVLIAPNVSEQMGGEGIKALQIWKELDKLGGEVIQITHARNREELERIRGSHHVEFIEDSPLARLLWKSVALRLLLNPLFSYSAVRLAERLAESRGLSRNEAVIHQTEPNSPVDRRSLSARFRNVFGPINGNIYYPAIFRAHESTSARLRRMLHFPLQRLNRMLPGGIRRADLILCAGGERTRKSLLAAGCPAEIVEESLDCGVSDELLNRQRISHTGVNKRYVHFGRLVFHKLTALLVEAVAASRERCTLDIIGRGPELDRCKQLALKLGVDDRVRFLDWYPTHSDLLAQLGGYRGVLFPSIEDANGIVVQEAMSLGLPVVALNWGGPQLLVEHGRTGFLVEPISHQHIVEAIASHMDELAMDGSKAEEFSVAGRVRAEGWRWSSVARDWRDAYQKILHM